MTSGIYEYGTQNNYTFDLVLTIHFNASESKSLKALRYSHTFGNNSDENERDLEFWVELLQMHQQCSNAFVIISLYAGKNLHGAIGTYGRRLACIVQTESQKTTMWNTHRSFQLSTPTYINLLENSGIVLVLLFL